MAALSMLSAYHSLQINLAALDILCLLCVLCFCSDDGSSDAEMVDEEGINVTAVMGGKKKRKAAGEEGQAAAAEPKPPKVRF